MDYIITTEQLTKKYKNFIYLLYNRIVRDIMQSVDKKISIILSEELSRENRADRRF